MEEVDEGVDSEVVGVVEAAVVVEVALEEGGVVVLEVDVVVGVVDLEVEEVGVVDLVEEVVALGEVEVAEEDQTDSGERERGRERICFPPDFVRYYPQNIIVLLCT